LDWVSAEMTVSRISDYFSFDSFGRVGLVPVAVFLVVIVLISGCAIGDSNSDSEDIVYSMMLESSSDVFKIDAETELPLRLTALDMNVLKPVWSPNKELVSFMTETEGRYSLWVMDAEGKSMRQAVDPSVDVADFRWSPDSVRIAIEIHDLKSGDPHNHWISILDTESDEISPLTSPTEDARVGDWSPDGEWVVYSVLTEEESSIRRKNPNGVDEITLFTGSWTNTRISPNPRWSRNGQWIAFTQESSDLVVMDKDGENLSVVVSGVNKFVPHDWSPGSKQLVYVSGDSDDSEIYVVGRDGKDVVQLTSNRVAERSPIWSPDGASILFQSEGDGSFDIYRMSKSGEQQVRLTSGDDLVVDADW